MVDVFFGIRYSRKLAWPPIKNSWTGRRSFPFLLKNGARLFFGTFTCHSLGFPGDIRKTQMTLPWMTFRSYGETLWKAPWLLPGDATLPGRSLFGEKDEIFTFWVDGDGDGYQTRGRKLVHNMTLVYCLLFIDVWVGDEGGCWWVLLLRVLFATHVLEKISKLLLDRDGLGIARARL